MPKTDDGFQGWRPSDHAGHGPVWDAMTSPERRRAFWGDIALGVGGTTFLYFAVKLLAYL